MTRKLLVMLAVLATAFATAIPIGLAEVNDDGEFGQTTAVVEGEFDSYIVVMEGDPLVATLGQDALGTAAADAQAEELVEAQDEALEEAGLDADDKLNTYVNALNGFSANITYEEAQELARSPKVALVMPDELYQPTTESSPTFIGLDAPGNNGAWNSGFTGEGVVVGVIDSGIWPEHPSFADNGLATPSVLPLDESERSACDFGSTTHRPTEDVAFTCQNKLIGARQMIDTYRFFFGAEPRAFDSARDANGHGTHTASTAAGNAGVAASAFGVPVGTISGIAPDAHIIAYKGLGLMGGFGSDLAAAIDQAVADGVDVINYSVGGGPSLTGPDDIAFLFAADAGVFVASSAGNSGPGPGTVGGPGSVPWLTTVGANTQERFFQGSVIVSTDDGNGNGNNGNGNNSNGNNSNGNNSNGNNSNGNNGNGNTNNGNNDNQGVDNGQVIRGASLTLGTGGSYPFVDAEFAGGDLCFPGTLDPGEVSGTIVLCRRGAIARADKSFAVSLAGGVGMVMYNNSDDDNLFTDVHSVPSVHVDLTPGLELKTYIADRSDPMAEIVTGDVTTWDSAPSMTIFSSRGPNVVAEDIIKPDITAPGHQILAGNSPNNDSHVQGELFMSIAGTSMSSPHIAGVFALIKEAHPTWSAAMAKSAIMTTADQDVVDNDRSTQATPFGMGAGQVDPGGDKKNTAFQPGLVYDAGFFEYLGFLCDAEPLALAPGTCPFLDSIGVPTEAEDLNLASIGVSSVPGTKTVSRTVTNVSASRINVQAKVDEPSGYDVEVSPNRLRLDAGESATFEVTFTNTSAPVGEWRFGALTWQGNSYKVRSPIAVRGSSIAAPLSIQGSEAAGTASFDVGFGYTGPYTAAPHGLAANAPVTGDISQDPDQIYPSPDDGVGVDKIDFTVSGSLLVRWSMVIPGDDDIDLYLEDSGGNIIAASTNGGTDELIELVLPADDTYTMVVHGWAVPNEPLPYTLSFWDVSATPGGSLSVDSAPASATIGTSGTVDISWTGAPAGDSLGAVSHSDGGGIIGITLVEIANPS